MASREQSSGSSLLARPESFSRASVSLCAGADAASARPAPRATDAEDFPTLYRLLRHGCRHVLARAFDLTISGAEHLPASGPFILAANHHNYMDGVVLAVALPRPI